MRIAACSPPSPVSVAGPGRAVTGQVHRGAHPPFRVHRRAGQHPGHDRRSVQRDVPQPSVRLHQGAVLSPLRLDRRQPGDHCVLRRRRHVDHLLQGPQRLGPLLPRPGHRGRVEGTCKVGQRSLARLPHLHRTPGHTLHPLRPSLPQTYRRPLTDPRPTWPIRVRSSGLPSALSERFHRRRDRPAGPSSSTHPPGRPRAAPQVPGPRLPPRPSIRNERAPTPPPPLDSPPRAFEPSSAASFRKNGTTRHPPQVLTRTGRTGHVTTWHKSGRRPRAAASEVAPRRCGTRHPMPWRHPSSSSRHHDESTNRRSSTHDVPPGLHDR